MSSQSVQNLTRGIIRENPTFVMLLGMCPTLGVTTSAGNGLGMGLATLFVLILSNSAISLVKSLIPAMVRIPCYIVIIASFVTVVDLLMAAYLPELHAQLGIFIPLIVVNCIILGRAEAFAAKNNLFQSILDAVGMGLGFTLGLTSLGIVREILGSYSVFGWSFAGEGAYPLLLFIMPPGAFIALAGLIIVFKVFATTATNGGGGCGGTFAPSLFLGCIAGFVFSRLWNSYGLFGIHVPETNYALLGMAGVMSGVFHAPLTGVFLIAELTGGYDLFIPLMIVSVASYLTINTFEPHSIYAMRLARKGELLTHHKDRSILTLMSLDAVIDKERPRLSPDMHLGQVVQIVAKSKRIHFAVTDPKGHLLGIINLNSIRQIIFRSELYRQFKASDLMERPKVILRTDEPMSVVMDKFQDSDAGTLPVLKPDGTFAGFISRTSLYTYYRQIMLDFSEE